MLIVDVRWMHQLVTHTFTCRLRCNYELFMDRNQSLLTRPFFLCYVFETGFVRRLAYSIARVVLFFNAVFCTVSIITASNVFKTITCVDHSGIIDLSLHQFCVSGLC